MRHRVGFRHQPLIDEHLDERVVTGLTQQSSRTKKIASRVSRVRKKHGPAITKPDPRERGRHTRQRGIPPHMRAQIPVGHPQPSGQLCGIARSPASCDQPMDESRRCEIAGGAAADTVRHARAPRRDERRILIDIAKRADVAGDAGPNRMSHHRRTGTAQRAKYPR